MIKVLLLNPEERTASHSKIKKMIRKQRGFKTRIVDKIEGNIKPKNVDICFLPGTKAGLECVKLFKGHSVTVNLYDVSEKDLAKAMEENCNVVPCRLK